MPQMTREEFSTLPVEERQEVLKQLEVKKQFIDLSAGDRQGVLSFLEANQKNQEVGQVEAGVRGAAQGVTFGFADELMAGLEAPAVAFLTDKTVAEAYDFGVKRKRARDVAAEAQHPGTFGTTEVLGSLATTAIPVAGALGKAGQAAKGVASAAGKVAKLGKAAKGSQKAVQAAEALASAEKVAKGARVGKGLTRGLGGIVKGTAGGAVTGAGKSEHDFGSKEFIKEVSAQTVRSGGLQAALNTAGPLLRGAGKLVVKNSAGLARAGAIGTVGFIKTSIGEQSLKKAIKDVGEQAPGLGKAVEKSIKFVKGGVETSNKYANILIEAFENQGGAGIAKAHTDLLQDSKYREFLKGK